MSEVRIGAEDLGASAARTMAMARGLDPGTRPKRVSATSFGTIEQSRQASAPGRWTLLPRLRATAEFALDPAA